MHKIAIILLGMASLAASGIITDQVRGGLNVIGGLGAGLQNIHGFHDIGVGGDVAGVGLTNIGVFSKEELLRQKFILDILQQVDMPLQKQELLVMISRSDITNGDLYLRPLTEEMLLVLDLIRNQQILDKQSICTISNDLHKRQMIGLYRLLVTARDFEIFKQLVIYGRQHINNELFVNALIIALGERDDTKMLVVPALHEILPQLYQQDSVIQQVQHLDTGVSTLKPNLVDVIGLGRPNRFLNPHWTEQQGGLWGVLNRSQMWMPWREMHRQLAIRKMRGGNVVQQNDNQMDKLVIQLPGQGLLTEDIGLKAYVNILVDELVVKQDVVRNLGIKTGTNIGTGIWSGRRGQINTEGNVRGLRNRIIDEDNEDEDYSRTNVNSQRWGSNVLGGRYNKNVNSGQTWGSGRLGRVGLLKDDLNVPESWRNTNIYYDNDDDEQTIMRPVGGQQNAGENQNGINTVSINDARLLFLGRRRKNPNNVVNLGSTKNTNYLEDMEMISGGRRVDRNERKTEKEQRNKNKRYEDDDDLYNMRNTNNNRYSYINRRGGKTNDDIIMNQWQRQGQGQGQVRGIGGRGVDRDDFLNIVTRGSYGRKQMMPDDVDDDDEVMQNRRYSTYGNNRMGSISLDMNLPTTSIDDERLLHINRRKLNDNIMDDDEENMGYGLKNQRNLYTGADMKYRNMYDEDDMNMNTYLGRDKNTGHRYRRSLDYQQGWGGDVDINESVINGKLLLQTLQQLVARLNVERIALGLPQLIDDQLIGIGRGGLLGNILNQQSTLNRNINTQTIQTVEDILQRIDTVLQQNVRQTSWSSIAYNDKLDQIGLLLAGQIQEIGLLDILGDILKQSNTQLREGEVANLIENEHVQVLLAGIVKIIDEHVQEIFKTRTDYISQVNDIQINNVEIDKLQTYLEQTIVDLSNLAQDHIDLSVRGNSKMIVGQVPRLNHKSFHIDIDATSQRQQQVVVRNLLVPKVDGRNNILPISQKRQNAILLDITTVDLKPGRNIIKLKSKDITLTSCDTTPYTKIYEHVMQALEGETMLAHEQICGQTDMLPHRLLIPRGRINGLPMQLVTVITPVQNTGLLGGHSLTGLDVLLLDNLPLNYPLHCDTNDLDKTISTMANLMVTDVKIYHDDNIKTPLINVY